MMAFIFFILQYPIDLQFAYSIDFLKFNRMNLQGLTKKKPSKIEGLQLLFILGS